MESHIQFYLQYNNGVVGYFSPSGLRFHSFCFSEWLSHVHSLDASFLSFHYLLHAFISSWVYGDKEGGQQLFVAWDGQASKARESLQVWRKNNKFNQSLHLSYLASFVSALTSRENHTKVKMMRWKREGIRSCFSRTIFILIFSSDADSRKK